MKKKIKIEERLNPHEVFKIYSKWVFKSDECRCRIPIRFNWDNPPTNTLSSFQRYQDRRNI